jgi:hypothetical protein
MAKFDLEKVDYKNFEKHLASALDFLNSLDVSKINILEDQTVHDSLFYINKVLSDDSLQGFNSSLENKCEKVFAAILREYSKKFDKYDFKNEENIDIFEYMNNASANQRCFYIVQCGLYSINLTITSCIAIKFNFYKTDLIKSMLYLLSNEKFLNMNPNGIIDFLALNIYVLTLYAQDYVNVWQELNAIEILSKLADLKPSTDLDAYLTIANIANDSQIETLPAIDRVLEKILLMFDQCVNDFKNDNFLRKSRPTFQNNEFKTVELHQILENKIETSIKTILEGIYKLSVNEKQREKMLQKRITFIRDLIEIIAKANQYEQQECLKLLSLLSFSEKVCDGLNENVQFQELVKKLEHEDLHKNTIKKLKWNMDYQKHTEKEKDGQNKKIEHVMISYNSASRQLCLQIKKELELLNYKVWMDVSDIRGSSLDSMAEAVENSFCVLICITEKYRQSINCQAEAQYAFKLNKSIIPLIMQKGYENVTGWLGFIMGDKIFINLIKYEFEECLRRLSKEILALSPTKKAQTQPSSSQQAAEPKTIEKNNQVDQMTQANVKEWMEKNKIDSKICDYLLKGPCDGEVLFQLYEIKKRSPEFYDQSLRQVDGLSIFSIARFSAALEKLFKS